MEREHALRIFRAAVAAVQPARLVREHLALREGGIELGEEFIPVRPTRNIYVVGAGKASAAMAAETEAILGDRITGGVVTTKREHTVPTKRIKVLEAAHPTPDEAGVRAVDQTLSLLRQATPGDLVICLLSGGASALWCDPPPGIPLADMQVLSERLLRSGAAIGEINTVRKHLSRVKGGQLVRYCGGAQVISLIISDVPGDAPDSIASGPTVADASTFEDAFAILVQYGLVDGLPPPIAAHLEQGRKGLIPETPKPGDPLLQSTVNRIIGNNRRALLEAEKEAGSLGYHTLLIPEPVTGDSEVEARRLVTLATSYKGPLPLCVLQGGEPTVKVTGSGKGGRNQHFALAALHAISSLGKNDQSRLLILSGGTDGTDGPTDAAGGMVDTDTLRLAAGLGLSIPGCLESHNAYPFLQQTGGLLLTGPTQTNVMDIMMAIVNERGPGL